MAATIVSPFENMSIEDMPALIIEKEMAGGPISIKKNRGIGEQHSTIPAAGYPDQELAEKHAARERPQEPLCPIVIPQQQEQCQQQRSFLMSVEGHFNNLSSPVTPLAAVPQDFPHAYSHPNELLLPSVIPTAKPAVVYYHQQQQPARQPFTDIAPHQVYPVLSNAGSADSLLDDVSSSASSVATISQHIEEEQETKAALFSEDPYEQAHLLLNHFRAHSADFVMSSSSSTASAKSATRSHLRFSSLKSKLRKVFSSSKQQQQQFGGSGSLSNSYVNNRQSLPTIPITVAAITTSNSVDKRNNKPNNANFRYPNQSSSSFNNNEYEAQPVDLPHRTSSLQTYQQQQQQQYNGFIAHNTHEDYLEKQKKRKSRNTAVFSSQDQPQLQFFAPASSTTSISEDPTSSSFSFSAGVAMATKVKSSMAEAQGKKKKSFSTKRQHRKKIRFDRMVTVYDTYSRFEYDRSSGVNVELPTSPVTVELIKQELNHFKMNEMQVHEDSVKNTHLLM